MKTRDKTGKQRIALVLQGGGALGAYQAGVYQAMHEHDLCPDWIVGTSIGAINAAVIAGNPPDTRMERLKCLWDTVSFDDWIDMKKVPDPTRQFNTWLATVHAFWNGVPGFFSPRLPNLFGMGFPVEPEQASFYDTSMLAKTLGELVDFDYLNTPGSMRLTVNAMKVTTGELSGFDNRRQDLQVKHILASGALPPGFPPVRIDGELYWDGGLFSNTPLETVLDDEPRTDTLCFMVDLWNPDGSEPRTLEEVETRQKDVTYASRSQRHIDAYLRMHKLRDTIRELYEKVPAEKRTREDRRELELIGSASTLHIVRLVYAGQDWHMASKDFNFSRGSIEWRWEQGYRDAARAIENAAWIASDEKDAGIVVHEVLAEHLTPYREGISKK